MMSDQKRALVVDDSKSARLILRRMLEKQGIIVDTVESATTALDFLNYNRPDVIFMDHMMPGMDGFQAVRAIKNNPDTATIPVMMYTSKGGDLYLGQARALGAVGVLPKTVAPAELFDSLQRLGLIPERRSKEREAEENGASERAEDIHKRPAATTALLEPGMPVAPVARSGADLADSPLRRLLDEQRVEIRKDMLLSIETVARQTGARLSRELDEKFTSMQIPTASPATGKLPLLLGLLLLLSLTWNFVQHKQAGQSVSATAPATATEDGVAQQDKADPLLAELQSLQTDMSEQMNSSWQVTTWALNQPLNYPYNEIALDAGRIEVIEQLLTRLRDSNYTGKVILETHVGEFCLLGDQEHGFRLPAPELPVEQCEFIGNPVQAADLPAAHQSLSFANFLGSTPLLQDSRYTLELVAGSRESPLVNYPPKTGPVTAYDWNRVAEQNNRLVIRLEPN
jgi:CheY-like chemotaxis protein